MKRLILLAGSLMILFQASAQELPTSFFVTAVIGITQQKTDTGSNTKALQVTPSVNYLLNARWSLGLFAEHNRQTTETKTVSMPISGGYNRPTSYSYESKYRSWTFGPKARYYEPIVSRLFIFGETQAGFRLESQEFTETYGYYYNSDPNAPIVHRGSLNVKNNATAVQVNVSPGLVYLIKPRFGIELKTNVLNYNHGLQSSRFADKESEARNFKADFSLADTKFGASFYF